MEQATPDRKKFPIHLSEKQSSIFKEVNYSIKMFCVFYLSSSKNVNVRKHYGDHAVAHQYFRNLVFSNQNKEDVGNQWPL